MVREPAGKLKQPKVQPPGAFSAEVDAGSA
jgi:hypothetical protein